MSYDSNMGCQWDVTGLETVLFKIISLTKKHLQVKNYFISSTATVALWNKYHFSLSLALLYSITQV